MAQKSIFLRTQPARITTGETTRLGGAYSAIAATAARRSADTARRGSLACAWHMARSPGGMLTTGAWRRAALLGGATSAQQLELPRLVPLAAPRPRRPAPFRRPPPDHVPAVCQAAQPQPPLQQVVQAGRRRCTEASSSPAPQCRFFPPRVTPRTRARCRWCAPCPLVSSHGRAS